MGRKEEGPWLESLKSLEGLWVSVLERAVRSKLLLGLTLRWLDLGLLVRKTAGAWSSKAAGFWGIPTAAQTREVLRLLQAVEDRLLILEDRLEEQLHGEQDTARREAPPHENGTFRPGEAAQAQETAQQGTEHPDKPEATP